MSFGMKSFHLKYTVRYFHGSSRVVWQSSRSNFRTFLSSRRETPALGMCPYCRVLAAETCRHDRLCGFVHSGCGGEWVNEKFILIFCNCLLSWYDAYIVSLLMLSSIPLYGHTTLIYSMVSWIIFECFPLLGYCEPWLPPVHMCRSLNGHIRFSWISYLENKFINGIYYKFQLLLWIAKCFKIYLE